MDKSHPLTTPMVVRSLELDKDPFRPREDDEEVLGPEIPYLGTIGAFILWIPENSISQLIGYADAGYLSDPHFGKSQNGYVFIYCGTAISWKSTKQTIVETSTNHLELVIIHEAGRECVWLRSIIKNNQESCELPDITRSPTVMFEYNTACIDQLNKGISKET
ncbi:secreted RxLR effector protein 161-like [Apium graveolens]|uniref:secreted RxLR effector protein 161-like n=1 Tax=Apium graveolens TaxID=4045 RepID=UPI003D7B83AE